MEALLTITTLPIWEKQAYCYSIGTIVIKTRVNKIVLGNSIRLETRKQDNEQSEDKTTIICRLNDCILRKANKLSCTALEFIRMQKWPDIGKTDKKQCDRSTFFFC